MRGDTWGKVTSMSVNVESKNTFQLIGESYIHGIVDGEAMDAMQIDNESNSCDKSGD
jgi:hypothetical protein